MCVQVFQVGPSSDKPFCLDLWDFIVCGEMHLIADHVHCASRLENEEAQYEACSALSELAFRNEENCMAIVGTPGALESLSQLLHPLSGRLQEDTALVVSSTPSYVAACACILLRCFMCLFGKLCEDSSCEHVPVCWDKGVDAVGRTFWDRHGTSR